MRRLFKSKLFITILCITLVLSACSAFALLSANRTSPVNDVVSAMALPLRKATTAVGDFFDKIISVIGENDSLQSENDELREKVAELEATIRDLEHYADENEELRDLLGITGSEVKYTLQMGEIISRSGMTWSRVLTADVGTADGISVYDAVITAEGLVGFVSSVDLTSCRITTLVDTGMSCSAILSRSRYTGVAEGQYSLMSKGRLQLNLLPVNADISVGETVETSGLGGVFPKGIVIGTVESTSLTDDGNSRTAVIRPQVDIDSVSTVFFVTDFETVLAES